jgi:hypothetical protein
MDLARFAAKLQFLISIGDLLFAGIQMARPSRHENDSGLLLCLEEAKGPHPEREEEADPPPAIQASQNEYPRDPDTQRKHCHTRHESLATLSGADIHHAHNVSN